MNKQALYGLIAGLFFGSWLLAEYYLGWFLTPFHSIIRFFALAGVFIILSIFRKRQEQEGFLTVGQGFRAGMGTAIVYIIVASISMYIYFKALNTGFVQQHYQHVLEALAKQRTDPSKAQEQAASARANFALQASVYTIMINLPLTMTLALLSSFALKKG
jgi:fatty acid desaturase